MTQRCLRSLARALFATVALVTTAGIASLSAQSTGKVQGHVTDAQNNPVANARVTVVGTAFSAPVNAQGYYFIENIPAGTYSLSARFIGYKEKVVAGLRILAGQTVNQDFPLEAQPVNLTTIVVQTTAAQNALVPRDEPTTKQVVTGDMVDKLPVDRIGQALALQPGIVQVTNCATNSPCTPLFSVRGGRVDQNATYIDGVPVQNGIHTGQATSTGGNAVAGAPQLQVATNGFEEADITTGANSASFGNAQAGIINISTRTGGSKFTGNLSYETGMLGGADYGQGNNNFAGSFGGPISKRLTFFASGRLEGNNAQNGGNHGWLFPSYSAVGIDTTYRIANASKVGPGLSTGVTDSVDVKVYNYAVTEGPCSSFQGISSTYAPIANNYGATCHANQAYQAPNTNYFTTDKLNYTFGQGSRLALSYIFSGNQQRGVLTDGTTSGTVAGSNVATLNWTQTLIREATHQLTLDAYISRQWNNTTTGRLTQSSESATRSSPLGIITHKLDFRLKPSDFPIDSTLIYNVLLNNVGHRIGLTDPKNTGQYGAVPSYTANLPPDGVCGCAAGGGGGDDTQLSYDIENRWVGKADIDFQADRYNRLKIGGEYTGYNITDFQNSSTGSTTFIGKPVRYDAYAEDHLDLGDVVLVAGVRYDYYWSKAWRWNEFPNISSRAVQANSGGPARTLAQFGTDSLFCPAGAAPNSEAVCGLVQDPSHNYVSPHIQVSFPVTDKTNFRLSYAQDVEAPDFGLIYANSLSDINTSGQNSRSRWGQDLDFGKTVAFEFGARHAFSEDMVLDVAVYNNDIVADPSFAFEHPINPQTLAAQVLYEVENTDFGNTRGIDVRLDRRIGNYFNGSLAYSFQDSKNTGTDPFAYLGFFEPLSGFTGTPPTAALPTGTSRPHSLTALFNVQLPADWEKGTILNTILKRTGFYVTGRIASGLPYTRCNPTDAGSVGVIAGNGNTGTCGDLGATEGFNSSRLPMLKQLDLRATKDFRVGRYQFTGYVDARNLLNLTNVVEVFAQTGTTSSGLSQQINYTNDSTTFATFGKNTGLYNATDGSLSLPKTIAGCGAVNNGQVSFAPECFYYIRSEQRFGNGDGVYTLAEQKVASDASHAQLNSIWNFVTGARTIRFGLEVNF
jgi:outer membrane receptor for ferrienterochelin and colicin